MVEGVWDRRCYYRVSTGLRRGKCSWPTLRGGGETMGEGRREGVACRDVLDKQESTSISLASIGRVPSGLRPLLHRNLFGDDSKIARRKCFLL